MSDLVTDNLLEEAAFYKEYFVGTIMEKLLDEDLRTSDLEQLQFHIQEARDTAWKLEYHPTPMAEEVF